MSRRRSRSPSPGRFSRSCSSNDPRDLERRIFVGNLPTSNMERKDLEELFSPYGKIIGVSMFRGFGFVQFESIEEAEAAKVAQKGRLYKGYKIDVNMATERRHAKPQSQQSPPRRSDYGNSGASRDSRPRSRSPYGRDSREPRESRDSRDGRDISKEPRTGSHPRDHDARYRGHDNREKDPRGDARSDVRDPTYREDYDRYYRGGNGADDFYRRKDEAYRDSYRDPWNGRREPDSVEERARPEERRRNELYRQYYEELQRRHDTERPVDCSVIVVNKSQKEYAETVGRKVRDLGMVVDLIFLNTEVSLTQALEDVGRARTPFAIIITQQHQVHRSCTVNILFGTPQEHRNMPMQDAMMLVAHNYDSYKAEHREKEREEIARKAAKMADDVLLREADRENHPVSVLTTITLLSENRFITPEELDGLIAYLKDKKARMVGSSNPSADIIRPMAPVAPSTVAPLAASALSSVAQPGLHGLPAGTSAPVNPNQQQELQAKILSLFNSGSGSSTLGTAVNTPMATQGYGTMVQQQQQPRPVHANHPHNPAANSSYNPSMNQPHNPSMSQPLNPSMSQPLNPSMSQPHNPSMSQPHNPSMNQPHNPSMGQSHNPSLNQPRHSMSSNHPMSTVHGYGGQQSRMPVQQGGQRAPTTTVDINLDNPSVQKALDTLIHSGPALDHLVNAMKPQQQVSRPGATMGQAPAMSMYPHHY